MRHLVFPIVFVFIFTSCSTKKYFEPKDTVGNYNSTRITLNGNIISMNRDGAALNDGKVITKTGVSSFKIKKGYNFLSISNKVIISSNYKDSIMLNDEVIKIDGVVVAASLKGDKLALIFSNNSIELLNINTKKILLKEYFVHSLVNDMRIANPYFMIDITLFPTLDGKIVIVSNKTNKVVRNIVVDANGQFNNIIFLDVINNTLIAATANKIISIGDNILNIKEYPIRDVISHANKIYVATIDGQIIQTDHSLNVINKKKYKYAKFYSLAYGSSLYALESQGYLINIFKDFKTEKIYDFNFDNKKRVIALGNTIYYDDKYIILK